MFWDGRAGTLQEQVLGPLYSPFEMAINQHALYQRLKSDYGDEIARLLGEGVLADEKSAVEEAGFALARFEAEDASFHAFTSKYDYFLEGEAQLTPAEARGLKLFGDEKKGNCAACHLDQPGADGAPPVFTDYEYEALGAPRNPAIPANADPTYFDLGICGPLRDDFYAKQEANCGLFETPTLRQRRDASSSTTASTPAFATWCASTCCAKPSRRRSIRVPPTGRSISTTTCRRNTAATSIGSTRPSTCIQATSRRSTMPRSMIWSPSSAR